MSPIKSTPQQPQLPPKLVVRTPPQVVRPFANHHGPPHRALEAIKCAAEHLERDAGRDAKWDNPVEPSPEARSAAALLGGFSQNSRLDFAPMRELYEENSRMGVEKILGNYDDDWSQASGMQRLIEAGTAESNFMHGHIHHVGDVGAALRPPQSPTKANELPAYQVHDGEASGLSVINGDHHNAASEPLARQSGQFNGGERKSILSSVMEKTKENARKRKSSAALPSTPEKNVRPLNPVGYPSSVPTSAISFNLDTSAKEESMVGLGASTTTYGERTLNRDVFEYFMSDKSRQASSTSTPGRAGIMNSPAKTSGMNLSPMKLGYSATPLSQFGSLGGPITDGCNSLLMAASDFDAVAALKDLSNSAPNTPSKLLRPRDESRLEGAIPAYHQNHERADEGKPHVSRKKPRTSFFGQVKAKVEERKTGV